MPLSELAKAETAKALITWFKARKLEPEDADDVMAIVLAARFGTLENLHNKIAAYIRMAELAHKRLDKAP